LPLYRCSLSSILKEYERSRIVQVLYAMEEKPTVSSNAGLKDAAKGKWYS